jgi:2-iminobutanoate/2-iminopropanoate deaminase
MSKQTIQTEAAPAAIGPYSQAVRAGGLLYVSGQIPLDPATGDLVEGGFEAETRRVLDNLQAVVEAAGQSLDKVLKVTIYLTDLGQFNVVNEVYGAYFAAPYPARACVEVAALPKGVHVEMDAIVQCD